VFVETVYGLFVFMGDSMTPKGREEIFDISEMHVISFDCPRCGTGIIFDVAQPESIGLPQNCSACKESVEIQGSIVAHYRRFFQRFGDTKTKFYFRVRENLGA
jgi:hypothetical protein